MSRYLAIHPRQYRPLPLGLIELFMVRAPHSGKPLLTGMRTTRAITPPDRPLGNVLYMALVNAHWAGPIVEAAVAEAHARARHLADCSEDTQPMDRTALFGAGAVA